MSKPRILVARAIFPDIVERLARHFDVESNPSDEIWTGAKLIAHLKDKQGVFTTGGERIDEALLAACPELKICANMAVGYNNFDLAAMTAHGVLATNAPDVLTETTADFGFALLMAAARRISEGERFLREGLWRRWSYDMFAGAEVHGSTLGIIGMGRIGQGIARRAAHGFGMRVLYHNRTRLAPALEAECGARYATQDELTAFATELEAAGHRLTHDVTVGPCSDTCSCAPSAPVLDGRIVVAIGTKPTAPAGGPVPIACTLTPGEAVDRVGDWARLLADQTGQPRRTADDTTAAITVTFPPDPDVAARAAELAAAEQACCAFIDFTLTIGRTGTTLTATTLLDAAPIIDALLGATP